MNSLIVEVDNVTYLIRYKFLKSVVSRKHTTKECIVINRLEKHPTSCEIYLYKFVSSTLVDTVLQFKNLSKQFFKSSVNYGELIYLGRGLSKCSDKDKFDKNLGIRVAISNIDSLDDDTFDKINYKLLNTKL